MKATSYTLLEQHGLVFETHCPDQYWFYSEESGGRRVSGNAPDLVELTVSLCFVLPPLAGEPGSYDVFTLSRSEGEAEGRSDLFLAVTYDADRGRFAVGAEPGHLVFLEDLPPSTVAGRVLRLLVIVRRGLLYASLDSEDGHEEIGVQADRADPGWAPGVWGAPATGLWRVTSGASPSREGVSDFPPGFGLSDVQVRVLGEPGRGDSHPLYSGALDVLTPWVSREEWERREEELHGAELSGISAELRRMASELETWVRRVHRTADSVEARAEAVAELAPRVARSARFEAEEATWE